MSAIVFLGAKGGVGTTSVALAHVQTMTRATVVDLDLSHGDLSLRLGVDVSATVADLAALAAPELVDVTHVQAVAYDVPGTRLRLVPSPAHPELAELAECIPVAALLDELARQGDDVVVDGGSRLDSATLCACASADEIVIVARADQACARQAGIVAELLQRAGVARRPLITVPRAGRRTVDAFAATLRLEPWRGTSARALSTRLAWLRAPMQLARAEGRG